MSASCNVRKQQREGSRQFLVDIYRSRGREDPERENRMYYVEKYLREREDVNEKKEKAKRDAQMAFGSC